MGFIYRKMTCSIMEKEGVGTLHIHGSKHHVYGVYLRARGSDEWYVVTTDDYIEYALGNVVTAEDLYAFVSSRGARVDHPPCEDSTNGHIHS